MAGWIRRAGSQTCYPIPLFFPASRMCLSPSFPRKHPHGQESKLRSAAASPGTGPLRQFGCSRRHLGAKSVLGRDRDACKALVQDNLVGTSELGTGPVGASISKMEAMCSNDGIHLAWRWWKPTVLVFLLPPYNLATSSTLSRITTAPAGWVTAVTTSPTTLVPAADSYVIIPHGPSASHCYCNPTYYLAKFY
ncbi:hypothetical protein Taro_016127 [Colocasia esculenta]|uniref:Uncharacterized protein n=1 Tax=Colocasia esculenta TaxID=4460 RepID=A0A843UJH5_COLES|nr:hypothetical protein [Colocasia esculenta]